LPVSENDGATVLVPQVVKAICLGLKMMELLFLYLRLPEVLVLAPKVVRAIYLGLIMTELLFLCLKLSEQFAWV